MKLVFYSLVLFVSFVFILLSIFLNDIAGLIVSILMFVISIIYINSNTFREFTKSLF